jgi:hypothetical protein
MSQVKRGDVVLLVLGGKTFNALVHQVVPTEESHLGADGQPTLHLSYIPDEPIVNGKPKVQPIGYIPESVIIHSVVHESHEFSPAYLEQHKLRQIPKDPAHQALSAIAKAEIMNRRGAGEWREYPFTHTAPKNYEFGGGKMVEIRDAYFDMGRGASVDTSRAHQAFEDLAGSDPQDPAKFSPGSTEGISGGPFSTESGAPNPEPKE